MNIGFITPTSGAKRVGAQMSDKELKELAQTAVNPLATELERLLAASVLWAVAKGGAK